MDLFGSYNSRLYKNSIELSTTHVASVGLDCIITRGYDGCLYVFSLSNWDMFVLNMNRLPFTKDGRRLRRYFCANAYETVIENNRINIPKELQKYIDVNVMIVGMIDRLEIWNKSDYDDSYDDFKVVEDT